MSELRETKEFGYMNGRGRKIWFGVTNGGERCELNESKVDVIMKHTH